MDAVVEEAWQAQIFRKSKLLHLYCLDTEYVFDLTVTSLPFLKLKCCFGHVSFPQSLSERRMVVFPKSELLLDKVKDLISPCIIRIKSSVVFRQEK